MSRQVGSKNGESARATMRAFFLANPEEWLSLADAELKFGVKPGTIRNAATALIANGLLEKVVCLRLRAKGTTR